jgi:LmbE family N-acetylglucosaminyl deacetylase
MRDALTLLTVHAHPDDETISTGGVMARYAAEGIRVVCITCTGGEHGEIVVPELDTPENHARLGEIRRAELSQALAHLGPIEHHYLGYVDSGMMGTPENDAPESFWQADFDGAVDRLLSIVRDVRPVRSSGPHPRRADREGGVRANRRRRGTATQALRDGDRLRAPRGSLAGGC